MQEMMNWYKIPGYSSYDINYYTREVRSCKHFNSGFHIMSVRSGAVRVVDDYGNPRSIKVADLYNLTFNSGNKLEPRGEYEMYCSGMVRANRRKDKNLKPGTFELQFGPNGISPKRIK